MMNTTLLAVRHGETQWNRSAKQQGHLNSDLTELGIRQAHAMAEGLKHFRIDCLYSSDLGRATQTAAIISQAIGKEFVTDSRLRERRLGILQGLTRAEFRLRYPQDAARFESNDPDYRIPGGESVRERYSRCIACAEELASRHQGQTVLAIAHGGVLMIFMHRALQLPLAQKRSFALVNGSINAFSIAESLEWRLLFWGDTTHLRANGLETLDDN
jgi:2,3-bisphosphoglycerate-dependent phosphoglycerate mutase